jgi:hypothetical protein
MYNTCFNDPWLWYYEGLMKELFRERREKVKRGWGEASLRTGVDRFWFTGASDETGPVEMLDLEVSPGPGRRVLYAPRWSPWWDFSCLDVHEKRNLLYSYEPTTIIQDTKRALSVCVKVCFLATWGSIEHKPEKFSFPILAPSGGYLVLSIVWCSSPAQ